MTQELRTDAFIDELGAICVDAADLFLAGLQPSEEGQWSRERAECMRTLHTDVPATLLAETTSTYLAEAAHQARGVGVLLAQRQVTATVDLLVRAILERAGRVLWLLDPSVSPEQRAARAFLEFTTSLEHYREALHQLGASKDVRQPLKAAHATLRRQILEAFDDVDRPPNDPDAPESKPTKVVGRWRIADQRHPTLTDAVQLASGSTAASSGTYDGLSGMSHPSVMFSREDRRIGDDGQVSFEHLPEHLEKYARFAAFGFLNAANHWVGFYGAAQEHFDELHGRLEDRLLAISLLEGDTAQPSSEPGP